MPVFKRLITLAAIGAASYLLMKLTEEEKKDLFNASIR